jgi:uncharacterized protein YbjT (DUF2867 family)
MKIAINGGTCFFGKHLTQELVEHGHQVVIISRGLYTRGEGIPSDENISVVRANVTDTAELTRAFAGCTAVVQCAGTSEDRSQTLRQVHVDGARSAVTAAKQASVQKFVLVSYLHARQHERSDYLTTKWEGEEIVKHSGLNYTILKVGLVYGQGDHLLTNLGNLLRRLPIFATV